MSALDKVLALAGQPATPAPADDPAGDLVLAARSALEELVALGADGDGDQDDDGHEGHSTYKALVKKGMDKGRASSMCAKADKRVKATRLAETALLVLSELADPGRDWVEATAGEPSAVMLTSGSTEYADPGYRGRPRFRIGTPAEARLSLAYCQQDSRMEGYTPEQAAQVRRRVEQAARGYGIALAASEERIAAGTLLELSVLTAEERRKPSAHTLGDSDDYPIPDEGHLKAAVARYKEGKLAGHSKSEVAAHIRSRARALGKTVDLAGPLSLEEAAELVVLAKQVGDGGIIMNHGPFTGTHAHGHFQSGVHSHPHQHFGDNHHDGGPQHRPGSRPGGRPGW